MNDDMAVAGRGPDWVALFAGDTALIVEFGQRIDKDVVDKVNALDALIGEAVRDRTLSGVLETVPTFRSLAIVYDPEVVHPEKLVSQLNELQALCTQAQPTPSAARHWQLPVLYNDEHGPDLNSVATLTGLSKEAVIDMHVNCTFSAYMLGFLPGYAFLGDTPEPLHLKRREQPRLRVPAGSVAIAMQLTGIYPWESPGGWHILGNCPVPMFNAQQDPPALLKAGDQISFTRVDEAEFSCLREELRGSQSGEKLTDSPDDRQRWLATS